MVGCLDFCDLLHVFDREHEDVLFAGHEQVIVVDIDFDDLGLKADIELALVDPCVEDREFAHLIKFLAL